MFTVKRHSRQCGTGSGSDLALPVLQSAQNQVATAPRTASLVAGEAGARGL